MARARAGLEKAVNDILLAHGQGGKRLSFRQAERLTGLSPATIGELAKGNARTPDSVRRFSQGLGEDTTRLLTLAGFASEEPLPLTFTPTSGITLRKNSGDTEPPLPPPTPLTGPEVVLLTRLERALTTLPVGEDRTLWTERLSRDIALIERWAQRLPPANEAEE